MSAGRSRLVLASASGARRRLLAAAGVAFEVVPARVDEAALRATLGPATPPQEVAARLAEAKALEVWRRHHDRIVIGADQVLALDGRMFAKPASTAEAHEHLRALQGQTHQLHSAVRIEAGDAAAWEYVGTAHLTMRALADDAIARYLARAGEDVCRSVGAYQLESLGVQLFERIEGDYFTILGLPLLPLLAELRRRRAIEG